MSEFKIGQTFFPSQTAPVRSNQPVQPKSGEFDRMLADELQKPSLEFSQHAQKRLQDRGIQLSEQDMDKLGSAVEKAEQKGANESLVVMDNVAYVVSVKNHTVITALDQGNMKDHVFTQIDSAIFT